MDIMRLNRWDTAPGVFPYSKWQIKLIGCDAKNRQKARLHVIGGGWDVVFNVADGQLIGVEVEGDKKMDFDYISANIGNWLEDKSNFASKLTNRELALIIWDCIDDYELNNLEN